MESRAPLRRALTRRLEASRPDQRGDGASQPPRGKAVPLVVLGVGSELRGDDAAGIRVASALARRRLRGVRCLAGGTAPENLTAEIKRLSPSHLLIVDAADMGRPAGSVALIEPEEAGGTAFGTHAMPLSVLAGYLRRETGCRVTLIGIQPGSLELGAALSPEVGDAVEQTVELIAECLRA